MEFRLVYEGRLPAQSQSKTRNHDKDRIRRILSRQIQELFSTHSALLGWSQPEHTVEDLRDRDDEPALPEPAYWSTLVPARKYSILEILAMQFERSGQQYVPLITNKRAVGCAIDILFLRRDQPGNLISHGGDLDNRIKVLFDALRVPLDGDEVLASTEQGPVYVLLEDDRLIVDVKITTDRLLTPKGDGEHIHEVKLIIHVKTVILDSTKWGSLVFG